MARWGPMTTVLRWQNASGGNTNTSNEKIDIMHSKNCKLLSKIKGNSIIWQHIWHNDKQICAPHWVHIPYVCHPFQSHLIISIMAADVYMHTNKQINKQTNIYTPFPNTILQILTKLPLQTGYSNTVLPDKNILHYM